MPQQKIIVEVPKTLKPRQRIELADLIIEHIVDRTKKGLNKKGEDFPEYSDAYVKSLDFKNAGKSRSKVDLQLSGDMLAALQLLTEKNGKLVIGYEAGSEENARAEGNILGSYGGSPSRKRARDFLGIEKAKLKDLIEYVKETHGE